MVALIKQGASGDVRQLETELLGDRFFAMLFHTSEPIVAFVTQNYASRENLRLYNTDTFEALTEALQIPGDESLKMAFSASGAYLAIASSGQLTILDLTRDEPSLGPWLDIGFEAKQLALTPDGERLVIAAADRIQVWHWPDAEQLVQFLTPVDVFSLSDDGRYLAVAWASDEGTLLQRWEIDLPLWQTAACRIAARNLTQREWQVYFGSLSYHATCTA
jgi:hypothetical protein